MEIKLSDIIKMFKGKSKRLVCVFLIFGIIGAGIGFVKTMCFGSWGNTVEFHLSSVDETDKLLTFLQSESFSELLLLDENFLPEITSQNADSYDKALSAINEYEKKREEIIELRREIQILNYSIITPGTPEGAAWKTISEEYARLDAECEKIRELLTVYKSAYAEAVAENPSHIQYTEEYEKQLAQALAKKKVYEEEIYRPALSQKDALDIEYNEKHYYLNELREEKDELREEVLVIWRNSEEVSKTVSKIKNALHFEYLTKTTSDSNKEAIENASFLNVTVSVNGDSELAGFILKKVREKLPKYVERSFENFVGALEVECTLMSPFSQEKNLSAMELPRELATKGFITALSALIIYCLWTITRNFVNQTLKEEK